MQFLQEYPCTFGLRYIGKSLSTSDRVRPLDVYVRHRGLETVRSPFILPPKKRTGAAHKTQHPILWGFYSIPQGNGSGLQYSLVGCADLTTNSDDPALHGASLEQSEPPSVLTGWKIHWLEPTPSLIDWTPTSDQGRGRPRKIQLSFTRRFIDTLTRFVGPPTPRTAFLYSFLQPRDVPGAVRILNPTRFQLWMPF